MGAVKFFDLAKEKIKEIESQDYQSLKTNIGIAYVKSKSDTGFHAYFVYRTRDGEGYRNTELPINPKYLEIKFDLREKDYWVKSNGKEVKFSERNIEPFFRGEFDEIIELISTDSNANMYRQAYYDLGALGGEYVSKPHRFLYRLIAVHPYYELLYKLGMEWRVFESSVRNRFGSSPTEIFGISKTAWKIYSKYGISEVITDRFSHKMRANERVLPKAEERMLNYLAFVKKLEDKYGIEATKAFYDYEMDTLLYSLNRNGYEPYSYDMSAIGLSKMYSLNEKRLIEYAYFEASVSQGMGYYEALRYLRDYYNMCIKTGRQDFDKYPRFLKTYHDVVQMNYRLMKNEEKSKLFSEAMEGTEKLEYKYGGLRIVTPKSSEDIVFEGNEQNHCVGSYVDRVINGQCKIVFLREDEHTPLVTVEIIDNRIMQAKGKFNRSINDRERKFLQLYAKNKGLKISTNL